MKCTYSCQSAEHLIARRNFLGGLVGLGASAGLSGGLLNVASAKELARQEKHVLVIFLHGGVSQLETWDPKPGTDTGGPFRAIPTSVPGVHISELLPHTARHMHRIVLVRGINTKENDHGKGKYLMVHGRKETPGLEYPHFGAVAAKLLADERNPLPGFIRVGGGGGVNKKDAAYLGPRYASVSVGGGQAPQNTQRPGGLSPASDQSRNDLRRKVNDRFARRRRTAETEAYTHSFEQALHLMERREVFDISKEPEREKERYGGHEFGQHCLLARRLLENGVSFVQVQHSNYDTHNENFDFHLEQLGEFDATFAYLLDDLAQRGLLQKTLVVVMSEFGRTPRINHYYGRDHWGTAWSIALAGCGLKHGAVVGKTNANGTQVVDREVDHGHLFHTYLRALALKSTSDFQINDRPVPIADPARTPIEEILA